MNAYWLAQLSSTDEINKAFSQMQEIGVKVARTWAFDMVTSDNGGTYYQVSSMMHEGQGVEDGGGELENEESGTPSVAPSYFGPISRNFSSTSFYPCPHHSRGSSRLGQIFPTAEARIPTTF